MTDEKIPDPDPAPASQPSYDVVSPSQPAAEAGAVPDGAATRSPAPSKPPAAPVESATERAIRPLVRSTHPEWPLAIAGVGAALFVAACLAGQQGLFPHFGEDPAPTVAWTDRAALLFRGLTLMLLCAGCLVGGAYLFHLTDRRPLGDLRVLSARMLAISAVSLLAWIFPIGTAILKRGYDTVAPIAIAFGLLMLFFRLTPRDAGLLLGASLLSLIGIALGSFVVAFAFNL